MDELEGKSLAAAGAAAAAVGGAAALGVHKIKGTIHGSVGKERKPTTDEKSPATDNPFMKSSQAAVASGVEADLDYYINRGKPVDRTVGWLIRRQAKQAERVATEKLNCVRDYRTGELSDLGEVTLTWCFVFAMPEADTTADEVEAAGSFSPESGKRTGGLLADTDRASSRDIDLGQAPMMAGTDPTPAGSQECFETESAQSSEKVVGSKGGRKRAARADSANEPWKRPEQLIPFQVWQFCHMLWKYDFHIQHAFSTIGNEIHILLGVPYQKMLEEASVMGLTTRLEQTLGTTRFSEDLIPRFKRFEDGTCLNSATQQGLTLFRMRRLAHIYADVMAQGMKKKIKREKFRKIVFSRMRHNNPVRALQLYNMFVR